MKWSQNEIRRLLRNLRRPDELERQRLGELLRKRLGLPSAYDAVLKVLHDAFANEGIVGQRLHDIVCRYDVLGSQTRETAASELSLSLRQFFRYRSQAVAIIATYIDRLFSDEGADTWNPLSKLAGLLSQSDPKSAINILELPSAEQEPEVALIRLQAGIDAGFYPNAGSLHRMRGKERLQANAKIAYLYSLSGHPEVADSMLEDIRVAALNSNCASDEQLQFDVLQVEFVRSRSQGNLRAADHAATRLRSLNGIDRDQYCLALLRDAEISIHLGDYLRSKQSLKIAQHVAAENRNLALLSLASELQAVLCFSLGDDSQAHDLAAAAVLAVPGRSDIAGPASFIAGRAALVLDTAWQPFEGCEKNGWDAASIDAIAARHHLRCGDFSRARDSAQASVDLARAQNYRGVLANSLVTLGVVAQHTSPSGARALFIEAWRICAEIEDRVLARDALLAPQMMVVEFGPFKVDDEFLNALLSVFNTKCPNLPFMQSEELMGEFKTLWRDLLAAALGNRKPYAAARATRVIAASLKHKGVSFQQVRTSQRELRPTLSFALTALLPLERRKLFAAKIDKLFNDFFDTLREDMDVERSARN